jgi:hypothetical protein
MSPLDDKALHAIANQAERAEFLAFAKRTMPLQRALFVALKEHGEGQLSYEEIWAVWEIVESNLELWIGPRHETEPPTQGAQ